MFPNSDKKDSEGISESERELKDLKEQLSDTFPVGPLIKKCCTLDQVDIFCLIVVSSNYSVMWFTNDSIV